MATYYISGAGCDKNDGLTPETAWKTTDHANRTIAGGDTVLLRCGDIFYGNVKLPAGTTETPTVLGAYGEGAKPQISLYKITTSPDVWTEVRKNVWKTFLADTANYSGNIYTDDTNVGFLLVNGEIHGYRLFSHDKLAAQWEFLCEGRDVYVYSEGNPNVLAPEIRFSVNGRCIFPSEYNVIEDVALCGSGGHGIAGTYAAVQILNCDIHDIGGSELPGYPTPDTRYGNGIELWDDTHDILVDGCRIVNCYDVAFTMQGEPKKGGWHRVTVKNCVMWGSHQSFEIWSKKTTEDDGMFDCAFTDNVCIGAGMGWSDGPRPNKECGVHLLLYGTQCNTHDIKIRNNIFYDTKYALYYKAGDEIPAAYDSDENYIYLRPGTHIINNLYAYTVEEKDEFIRRSGKEANSVFRTLFPTDETMDELVSRLKRECFGK